MRLLLINTFFCPIKVNSNTMELTVHTSCYYVLDLLCVITTDWDWALFQHWMKWPNQNQHWIDGQDSCNEDGLWRFWNCFKGVVWKGNFARKKVNILLTALLSLIMSDHPLFLYLTVSFAYLFLFILVFTNTSLCCFMPKYGNSYFPPFPHLYRTSSVLIYHDKLKL